jgi:signal transduction histidine kinase
MVPGGKIENSILVVEDSPGDFALVEELISQQANAPVINLAKTFREAKQLLTKPGHSFNLVLLDLSLPDHAGEPLIREMIALCRDIPVIVLTGYADFTFGVRSLAMGVSDYLLKDDLNAMALYKSMVYSIERKRVVLALETSEKRVRNFAGQLNNAVEEERSRIAREIHDEFGQQLSGLKMSLSALKRSGGADQVTQSLIDVLVADVDTSIASVRQIANELRPVLLDKLGWLAAVEWLAGEFEKKTGINTRFFNDTHGPAMNKMTEINIFRICQEAFTNIARHANASRVDIHIKERSGRLSVSISDNGDGMGPEALYNPLSMGLLNMKERAQLIGAELQVSSAVPTGTIIEFSINHDGS